MYSSELTILLSVQLAHNVTSYTFGCTGKALPWSEGYSPVVGFQCVCSFLQLLHGASEAVRPVAGSTNLAG